jgi:hypothetical protein
VRNDNRKRYGIIAATTAAVLIGGGVAVAYWTISGSGTGSATTGTTTSLTVSGTNTPSGLYPGGPSQAVDFQIVNPNAGSVYVNQVTVSVTGTNKVGCDASDFSITQPTAIAAEVNAGTTSYAGGTTGAGIAMINKGVTQDACKNATVNLAFSSN